MFKKKKISFREERLKTNIFKSFELLTIKREKCKKFEFWKHQDIMIKN